MPTANAILGRKPLFANLYLTGRNCGLYLLRDLQGQAGSDMRKRVTVGLWLLAGALAMVIAGRAVVAQLAPPPPAVPNAQGPTLVTPVRPPAVSPIQP